MVAALARLSSVPLTVPLLQAQAGRDAVGATGGGGYPSGGGGYQAVRAAPTADHAAGASLCCTNPLVFTCSHAS